MPNVGAIPTPNTYSFFPTPVLQVLFLQNGVLLVGWYMIMHLQGTPLRSALKVHGNFEDLDLRVWKMSLKYINILDVVSISKVF
jgi:hypothetical protein